MTPNAVEIILLGHANRVVRDNRADDNLRHIALESTRHQRSIQRKEMRLRKRELKNEDRESRRNAPGRKGRNIAVGVGAGTGIAAGGIGAGALALQGRKLLKTHGDKIGQNLTDASANIARTTRHAERTARVGREAAVGAKRAKRNVTRAVKRPFSAIGRLGKRVGRGVGGKVGALAKEARFRYGGVAKKLLRR
jgi:hypothetical protein